MNVELLAVGTELLLGDVTNTNAAWLGRRLAEAGLDLRRTAVVGDNVARIAAEVRAALPRCDALLVTGGLGPTQDDLTREALAEVAGVPLVRDPGLAAAIEARLGELGRRAGGLNLRQADLPAGATAIHNPVGTAPGIRLETAGRVVYALPGVPREMTAMVEDTVLADLLARAGEAATIASRVLRVAGMWESAVAEALAPLVERLAGAGNPTLAFLAGGGEVSVRVTAKAADATAARALCAPVVDEAAERLGPAVYGSDDDRLDAVVHRLLAQRSATVAVAESLTGGALGAALTERAGSSATFRGGVTAYATALKAQLLGVPADALARTGPVDPAVAEAMAAGVRDRLGADYGLATTGVAGPGPADGAPAGRVYVAVAGPAGAEHRRLRLPGDRAQVRGLAVVAALDLLRRHLLRLPPAGAGPP